MSEFLRKQKTVEHIDLKEGLQDNFKSVNIERIEGLFSDKSESPEFLAEQEKCCKKLNKVFGDAFEKNGIDFYAALRKTVENPVGLEKFT